MKYRVHHLKMNPEKDIEKLEKYLNDLKGEVVTIVPNIARTSLFQIFGLSSKVNFILIIEKI